MKRLIAFDLDGTLAESKQPIDQATAELLAELLKCGKHAASSRRMLSSLEAALAFQ